MTVTVRGVYTDIKIDQGTDLVCFPDDMTGSIRPGALDKVAHGAVIIWGKNMTAPIDPLVFPVSKACHLVLGPSHKHPLTKEIMDRVSFVYIHKSNQKTGRKFRGYYLWDDQDQSLPGNNRDRFDSPIPASLLKHYGQTRRYAYYRTDGSELCSMITIGCLLTALFTLWACIIVDGYNHRHAVPFEEQVCAIEEPNCDLNEGPFDFAGVDKEMRSDTIESSLDLAELKAGLANIRELYENHLMTAHEMAQKQAALIIHLMQSQRDLGQLVNNLGEIEL